ncbi:Spatacsin-like isoform X3 [Oopsacas minuta]|uniref:Spatacsin-like isoform X3 n=1 Tax=Oopsacas minuta TaxID=111878 RepID=A0AAV7JS20_9METZ|nr:Spatacsin-like isoform X3 [Oopsacas minuta]
MAEMENSQEFGLEAVTTLNNLVLTKLRQFSFPETSKVTRVCVSPDSKILAVTVCSEEYQELILLYHPIPDPSTCTTPSFDSPTYLESLTVCKVVTHLWLTPNDPNSWCRDRNILVVLTAAESDASILWIEVSAGTEQGVTLLTLFSLSLPDLRTMISEDKRSAPTLSTHPILVDQLSIRLLDCKHDEVLLVADPCFFLLLSISSDIQTDTESFPSSLTSPILSTLLPLQPLTDIKQSFISLDTNVHPHALGTLSSVNIRGPIMLLLYSNGYILLHRIPSGDIIGTITISEYLQCCISEDTGPGESESLSPPYTCISTHPHIEYIAVANKDNYVIVIYLRRYLMLFPSHLNLNVVVQTSNVSIAGQDTPTSVPTQQEDELLKISQTRSNRFSSDSPLWSRRLKRLRKYSILPSSSDSNTVDSKHSPSCSSPHPKDSNHRLEAQSSDNPFSSNFTHEIPSPSCDGCTWFSSPPSAEQQRVLAISCESDLITLHYTNDDVRISYICVFNLETGERRFSELSQLSLPIYTYSHASDKLLLLLQDGWGVCPVVGLSRQSLLAGILAHCDASAAELLCQHNGWQQSLLPVSVLRESLAHRQLDSVCFYLRMRRTREGELELVGGTGGEERNGLPMSFDSIKQSIDTLYGTLRGSTKDSYEAQFSSQVLHLSHKFVLFLLIRFSNNLKDEQLDINADYIASELAKFRQFMRVDNVTPGNCEKFEFVSDGNSEVTEGTGPPTPVEWRHMRKSDIIRDALDRQCLPLVQSYLHSRLEEQVQSQGGADKATSPLDLRYRSAEISWYGIRQLVLHLAYQCMGREDLSTCKQRLAVVGRSVPDMLRYIATHTSNRFIRGSLYNELKSSGTLGAAELDLFEFLQVLEHTYPSSSYKQTLSYIKKSSSKLPAFPEYPTFRDMPPSSSLTDLKRTGELDELCPEYFGANKPILSSQSAGKRDSYYFSGSYMWVIAESARDRDLLLMEGFLLKNEHHTQQCSHLLSSHTLLLLYTSSQMGMRAAKQVSSLVKDSQLLADLSDSVDILLGEATRATRSTQRLLSTALTSSGVAPSPPTDTPLLTARVFQESSEAHILLSQSPSLKQAEESMDGFMLELSNFAAAEGCASFLCLSIEDLNSSYPVHVSRFMSRVNQENEEKFPVWIKMLALSKQLGSANRTHTEFNRFLFQYSIANARYVLEQPDLKLPDTFHLSKPLIPLATLIYAPVPLEDTIGGSADYSIPREILFHAIQPYPKLLSALFPSSEAYSAPLKEVTVYELLHGSVPFNLQQLFAWQSTNQLGEKSEMEHSRKSSSRLYREFPHFSSEEFSQTYGCSQKLDYIHYLNKGNPAFAYANLLASDPKIESKYCSKRMKSVCQRVYRLGLSQHNIPKVTSSCAALMEMLGWDSAPFRTDIVLLNLLLQYEGHAGQIKQHALALQDCLSHSSPSKEGFLALSRYAEDLFRGFMTSGELLLDNFVAAEVWAVLENFCQYHDLPPTRSYLERCASSNLWPQLLSYAQMWSSPPKLLLEIIREYFHDCDIKDHLETAVLVMMEQKTSFSEQAKRKISKPSSKIFPTSNEGRARKRSSSKDPHTFPTASIDSTPVEVFELLPIDRSSRFNRSDNLFELVCASQTSPYSTARTLLAFGVSLRRDILPLLATCFITQREGDEEARHTPPPPEGTREDIATILDCLCVWIFCKLSSSPQLHKAILSLDIIHKREDLSPTPLYQSNHLQWHQWELKDLELVCVCLSSNIPAYGIILKQAFRFFDYENPYVHFLRFVETYALHSFDQSQKQLESFLTCLKKLCSGEQQYPKNSIGSPKWVSDLSSLCLLQMLAHPLTPWHHISLLTTVIKALERVQQPYKLPKDPTFDPALHVGFTVYPIPLGDLLDIQRLNQLLSVMQPMEKVPIEITCRSTVPILPDIPTSSWLNSLTQPLPTSLPPEDLLSQLAELGITDVVEQICDIVHLYPTKAVLRSFELRYQQLMKSSWWNILNNRIDFWQNCNTTLQSIKGDINLIAEFFERIASSCHGDGEEIGSSKTLFSDAILLRQLALDWHLKCTEHDPVKISSLKKMVWLSRLEWITSGVEPSVCLAHILKTTSRNPDVIGFYDLTQLTISPPLDNLLTPHESPELNQDLKDALSLIFGLLLDANLLSLALELADLFKHRPLNIVIVCTCIGLAQRSIESKHIHPSVLSILNLGDAVDSKSELTSSLTDTQPIQYMILFRALLEQSGIPGLIGGYRCVERIQALSQISQGLVMSYNTTANEATRTSLLTILTSEEIGHKFQLALPFVRSCCVDPSLLAIFLERCIYITLCRHFGHSYEMNPDDPVIVRPVFDVDSKSEAFSELTRICNEAELGRLLLQHASKDVQIAQASKAEPRIDLLQVCIELLIRAETCLSNACQLDQISNLINATLALARVLTLRQCWSLLARLLTGIGRFHELSDILEIFVNHEQLEYLLKKGLDKEELLKTALLKFLVKHHENDIDKLTIVAMRFNLYRGLGETCVKQAKLLQRKLTHDYPKLEDFPDVKERVREVCKLFCNAATYYSLEDCYMQASECKQQARLMCAQYRLLPYNIIVVSMSKMGIRALLATHHKYLHFPEVLIIADAYGLNNPKSWGDILYGRCVRNKNANFFSSYLSKFPFNSLVYKHLVSRLTTENPKNAEYRENLTHILSTIPDMTIKHHLFAELAGTLQDPPKFQHSLSHDIISELQNL